MTSLSEKSLSDRWRKHLLATRLLLSRDTGLNPDPGVSPVSPSFDPGWDDTAQFGGRFRMVVPPLFVSQGPEGFFNNAPESTNVKYLWVQYISDPLNAQTISGTIKGQIRVAQSFVEQRFDQVVASIRACSNDGTIIRGTLLSIGGHGTTNLFEAGTPENRKIFDGDSLTPLVLLEGDRLIFEVGSQAATDAPEVGEFITMICGDDGGSDLPEDETTQSALNPWIEFSQTLLFPLVRTITGKTTYDLGFSQSPGGPEMEFHHEDIIEKRIWRGERRHGPY